LTLVLIDVDKDRALSTQWDVRSIPTMHFADVNGNGIEKYAGGRDAESFAEKFGEIAQKHTVEAAQKQPAGKPAARISIPWETDIAKARESSKKTRKVVFVLLSANIAAASRKIEEMGDAFSDKAVEQFVFFRLQEEWDPETAKSLGMWGEGVAFLNPDEPELGKSVLVKNDRVPSLADLKALVTAYKKGGYSCDKCKKTSFVKQTCCDSPMKAAEKK
jgi:hypothetical protein